MRQPVGVRIQRRVAQLAIPAHRRNRIRRRRRLRREQLRQAAGRQPRATSRSTPRRCRARSAAASDLKAADRSIRRAPPPPPAAAPDEPPSAATLARSNRSVAYSSVPAMPARRAIRAAQLAQAQRQVELRRRGRNRLKARRNPVKLKLDRRVVLERQHHLEQRVPRQRPRRVEHLDQPLKRNILVAVGRKIVGAHPRRSAPGSSGCPRCRCAAPAC